jgi:SAM-dependent methyltransferase
LNSGMYYRDKVKILQSLFGVKDITLDPDRLRVGRDSYPIVQDVIILSPTERQTPFVRSVLSNDRMSVGNGEGFSEAVQYSFGDEWSTYPEVLPEHRKEFEQYFDLLAWHDLKDIRACDLGCGNGRWSLFLKDLCRELILVDFSDAIFVARRNLSGANNCLFFMGDLRALPFQPDCCDLLFCMGVLHHLPTPCLEEVRRLRRFAPRLLIFLYYAFENRPAYFRMLLSLVTVLRQGLCRIRSPRLRRWVARIGAVGLYKPLVLIGTVLRPLGFASSVPLYDFYQNKSARRIEQDVYDRFFTPIEQRVSRTEILGLGDTFSNVIVSDQLPYWHFLCTR